MDPMTMSPAADLRSRAPAVHRLRQLIAGDWTEGSGAELVDTNPARPDEVVARGPLADAGDLDRAVAAARRAFAGWSATPHATRGTVLVRAADILERNAGAWGAELAREEGKTLAEGIGEVRRGAEILRFSASEAQRPSGEIFASPRAGEQIHVVHKPVGVVAVITPFNFPVAIPAWKIAPALSYGNVVVWKPASTVPLLAVRLAEALLDAGLPEGVLSLLITGAEVGNALVAHDQVDAVTFTGSTSVGRRLMALCGELGRPIQTEMGGKNAAAVLADADLEVATTDVLSGAFRSSGQKCTATSRLIVANAIADELIARVVERARGLTVGDPLTDGVYLGPVISRAARDEIQTTVADGTRRPGVTVLAGGEPYRHGPLAEGAFVAPTVVELAGDDPLWRDEIFGPVLAVRRAPDDRTALELVNDSVYGLSAAIFTESLSAATAAMDTVDVGVLHINSETAGADPHVPFGGTKASGFGPKEQGRAAREFFTKTRTIYLRGTR
jgi:alpha-ketoglutaric semialdehyde dehydrogenase